MTDMQVEIERQFRTLVELASVGIYLADAAGNCTYVNRRWCEMAGMEPEVAVGRG